MKNPKGLLPLLLILMTSLSMCTKEKAEPTVSEDNNQQQCDTLDHQFAADVKPIFTGNCAISGCHDASSSSSGYIWETHSQIKDGIENGPLMCAIRHEEGCTNMPYGKPKLKDSTIQKIQCWIDDGYPND